MESKATLKMGKADNTKVGITIPEDYYRCFRLMGEAPTPMRYYREYSAIVDKLTRALWDQSPGSREVIRVFKHTVVLEKNDSLSGRYWTSDVVRHLSDRAGLGMLWDRRINDR